MNIATRLVVAAAAGFVACAPIVVIPLGSVNAAEKCLLTPEGETLPGQHWYYRSERSTQRRCWYLRDEGVPSSQAPTAARRMAPDRIPSPVRSAAEAYAEMPLPQSQDAANPTKVAASNGAEQKVSKAAPSEPARSPLALAKPEPTGAALPSATEQPITPVFVVASPAPQTDRTPTKNLTSKAAPVATTKLERFAIETPNSLRILLLGTFGAIATFWLVGRAIMGRMRRRPKRGLILNSRGTSREGAERTGYSTVGRADASPSYPAPARSSLSLEHHRKRLGESVSEIEQLLARFANEAQVEH